MSAPRPIIRRPSPNHGRRPAGMPISCVVLHADAGKSEDATLRYLAEPQSKVSYHYLIGRGGTCYQLVADSRRAWHAGASIFDGQDDVNTWSLGVSFANDQRGEPYRPAQLAAGVQLVADLCERYRIPLPRITTHQVIRDAARKDAAHRGVPLPEKKVDPGPLFPFAQFVTDVGRELARRREAALNPPAP